MFHFGLPTGNLYLTTRIFLSGRPSGEVYFISAEQAAMCHIIYILVLYSMGAIAYSNYFVLGIWMVFIPCTLGQLDSDQGFVQYEQSSVNIPRFRSSNDAEVLFHRRHTTQDQVSKERKKRFVTSRLNDKNWNKQSYLSGLGNIIADHNVSSVWQKGYTGKDILVAVVDNGVNHQHLEFSGRYRADLSYDYVNKDADPTPLRNSDGHGTKCAGVIAGAANNRICGVGVAYEANIAGIQIYADALPNDTDVASAFYPSDGHQIDIFSNSWGPPDTGFNVDGPGPLTMRALQDGTRKGRNGRGSIYVFSAGNGAVFGDNCALNGFVNSIYTIPVAAVDQNGKPASASEPCSAVMTSAYSVDLETASAASNSACNSKFGATSGATALVSGMIALAIQARNNLTWREVQHLVVKSSRPDVIDKSVQWTVNGAGFSVSSRVGFGFLDASLLVTNAENLNSTLPPQRKCEIVLGSQPLSRNLQFQIEVDNSTCSNGIIERLEHVVAIFDLEHFKRGVLGAYITSPGLTKSQVLSARQFDSLTGRRRYENVATTSVHFWGEQSYGTWEVSLRNDLPSHGTGSGTLFRFSLILYGTGQGNATAPKPTTYHTQSSTGMSGTTSAEPTTSSTTPPPKKLSVSAVIGIVFGSVSVLVVAIVVLVMCFIKPKCTYCCKDTDGETGIPLGNKVTV